MAIIGCDWLVEQIEGRPVLLGGEDVTSNMITFTTHKKSKSLYIKRGYKIDHNRIIFTKSIK